MTRIFRIESRPSHHTGLDDNSWQIESIETSRPDSFSEFLFMAKAAKQLSETQPNRHYRVVDDTDKIHAYFLAMRKNIACNLYDLHRLVYHLQIDAHLLVDLLPEWIRQYNNEYGDKDGGKTIQSG